MLHLKELREKNQLTQAELSKLLGISPSTIGMYEQGRREPDNDTLKKIASLFGVSTDYLLGNDLFPSRLSLIYKNAVNADSKLGHFPNYPNHLGVDPEHFIKWMNGESEPTEEEYEKIGKVENISVDWLKGKVMYDRSPMLYPYKEKASSLPPLTPKDEREISKDLENMIETLDGAAAMGGPDDEEDLEMLKASLKQAMMLSKRIAKKKFTPKKYQKD